MTVFCCEAWTGELWTGISTDANYLGSKVPVGSRRQKRGQVSLIASPLSPAELSRLHARNAFVPQVKSSTFSIEQWLG